MTLVSYTSKIGAALGPEAPLPSQVLMELLPSLELSYPANREDKRESDCRLQKWRRMATEECESEGIAVSGLAHFGLLTEGDPHCSCEMHVTPE